MEGEYRKCPYSGKQRFETYREAQRSQRLIIKRHGPHLNIYRCGKCKGYHFTHRKVRRKE